MAAMNGTFRRHLDALPEIFELAHSFVVREALQPALQFPLDFALEEIFTNLVKYNGQGDSDVEVDLKVSDGELIITVTDFDTHRFDVNEDAPEVDITKPLSERVPGGLGLHLVKKMMDRLQYSHENRTGIITLYKRLE